MPILDLLQAKAGERIPYLGFDDSALTLRIARNGCTVLGVDLSILMVEVTIALGVEATAMRGDSLTFDREFESVFSNAALH